MLIAELNGARNATIENMYKAVRGHMLQVASAGGRSASFLSHSVDDVQDAVRNMLIDNGIREDNIHYNSESGGSIRDNVWCGDESLGLPAPKLDKYLSYKVCTVTWSFDGDSC